MPSSRVVPPALTAPQLARRQQPPEPGLRPPAPAATTEPQEAKMMLTADQILAAMDEASWMAKHIASNSQVMRIDEVEEVVFRALGSPIPDDIANGVPLLKYANGSDAVLLLDAILRPPRPHADGTFRCDIYGTEAHSQNIIWVPCGAAVAQLMVGSYARDYLDAMTTGLVWF